MNSPTARLITHIPPETGQGGAHGVRAKYNITVDEEGKSSLRGPAVPALELMHPEIRSRRSKSRSSATPTTTEKLRSGTTVHRPPTFLDRKSVGTVLRERFAGT